MNRITVVISQGQSQNPAKRRLEEDIVAPLLLAPGIDVTIIPHLYDLKPDGTGMLALQGIQGDMVVLSWLYERGARWTLDRSGIRGQVGETLIRAVEEEDDEQPEPVDDGREYAIDRFEIPQRKIYCVDLRVHKTAQPYLDEVKRIAAENRIDSAERSGRSPAGQTPLVAIASLPVAEEADGNGSGELAALREPNDGESGEVRRIDDQVRRRWYPVIDYSRCTNCMECIDFCLFGVYGVDEVETILVEQPDNCRKGCPACSRVCPENAIIFPQHKMPAIAGAPVDLGGLKIDLSRIFGAPSGGQNAIEIAAAERDEQLQLAGREPVGADAAIPRRQAGKASAPKDELDDLIDALDDCDL